MNDINMLVKLADDAKSFTIKEGNKEKQLVSFSVLDFGTSGKTEVPMIIEVHFQKEVGIKLLPYLKKGKEVYVNGFVANKRYVTSAGIERDKYYVSADYVCLTGLSPKAEGVAA